MISIYSVLSFSIIFVGYNVTSMLLQLLYYCATQSIDDIKKWKIQHNNIENVGTIYCYPFTSKRSNYGKYHKMFTSINILIASLFACTITELVVRGYSKLSFESINFNNYYRVLLDFLVIVIYENIIEYYWHRLMHTKLVYPILHKYHHFYKSPEPFDDLYIHPIEAFGYYCILYSPPILFNCHFYSFIGYMILMGTFGILDHSGIIFEIYGIYNTVDHDNHHLKFEVNYGFPFIYMDILHGTYEGDYLGYKFVKKKSK